VTFHCVEHRVTLIYAIVQPMLFLFHPTIARYVGKVKVKCAILLLVTGV